MATCATDAAAALRLLEEALDDMGGRAQGAVGGVPLAAHRATTAFADAVAAAVASAVGRPAELMQCALEAQEESSDGEEGDASDGEDGEASDKAGYKARASERTRAHATAAAASAAPVPPLAAGRRPHAITLTLRVPLGASGGEDWHGQGPAHSPWDAPSSAAAAATAALPISPAAAAAWAHAAALQAAGEQVWERTVQSPAQTWRQLGRPDAAEALLLLSEGEHNISWWVQCVRHPKLAAALSCEQELQEATLCLQRAGQLAGQGARALEAAAADGGRRRLGGCGADRAPEEQRLARAELHLRLAAEDCERWGCSAGCAAERRRLTGKVLSGLRQAVAALTPDIPMPALQLLSVLCARLDAEWFLKNPAWFPSYDENIIGLALQHHEKLTILRYTPQAAMGGVVVLELRPHQPYPVWYQRLFQHVDEVADYARRWPALRDQLRVARDFREATQDFAPRAFPRGAIVLLEDLHLAVQVALWEWRFGEPWARGGGARGPPALPPAGRGFRARDVVVHAQDVELWSAAFATGGFRPRRVRPFRGQLELRAPRTFVEVVEVGAEEEAAAAEGGTARRSFSCPPAARRRD